MFALVLILLLLAAPLQAVGLNDRAPSFSLKNFENKQRRLSDYRGRTVFLNFWASWCAPCRQELPELNRLAAEYKNRGVRVVAINVDQSKENAKELIKLLNLSQLQLEVLWDFNSKAVGAYDIQAMPSSFIIDPNGVIRANFVGYQASHPAQWRQEIEKLN